MSSQLNWRGAEVLKSIASQMIDAVNEIDGRIEAESKKELYPGHGKRSGVLQRGIQAIPAYLEGTKVRGGVGVKGVRYALRIHARYQYIVNGLERVKPQINDILRRYRGKR